MKKIWLVFGVLFFVSTSASAQLTSGLMNYEVTHNLLPKDKREISFKKANQKAVNQIRAEKGAAAAQEHLKSLLDYYKKFAEDSTQPEVVREKRMASYKLLISFTEQHSKLVELAAQEKPEEIVLQNLRYQMEALYHSWAEIKTLDGSMAYHIREIVRGHKYWIECLDTAVSLYGVVNEIHRITIRIEGEGENFF